MKLDSMLVARALTASDPPLTTVSVIVDATSSETVVMTLKTYAITCRYHVSFLLKSMNATQVIASIPGPTEWCLKCGLESRLLGLVVEL